ncbi:MAG: hypothetical protein WC455_10480 [Dehalococcoidia bacterium]|jgi:hypothetical protein
MFTEEQRQAILKSYDDELKEPSNLLVSNIVRELNKEGAVLFYIEYMESEDDSWLQAEYDIPGLGMTVILDSDVSDTFGDAESWLMEMESVQEKLEKLNRFLKAT